MNQFGVLIVSGRYRLSPRIKPVAGEPLRVVEEDDGPSLRTAVFDAAIDSSAILAHRPKRVLVWSVRLSSGPRSPEEYVVLQACPCPSFPSLAVDGFAVPAHVGTRQNTILGSTAECATCKPFGCNLLRDRRPTILARKSPLTQPFVRRLGRSLYPIKRAIACEARLGNWQTTAVFRSV